MSEMSSFYGGRQGNSIVIAKRFDGIDIPQSEGNYTYTRTYYAIDKRGNFLITDDGTLEGAIGVGEGDPENGYTYSSSKFLIKRTKENYLGKNIPNFGDWKGHENDGALINDTDAYVFVPELAQGMVQFFKEGAKTSSEVNYGAYVIIDTILRMSSKNDPDNGKVYRRGMDINSTDGLAGAEYIGQIVGPQGESPEFEIETYNEVIAHDPHQERTYTGANEGIVPGSYIKDGVRMFEDDIQYAWATIRDEFGNVEGCRLGFKVPTLVQDYEAQSMSPYEQRKKDENGEYYNYDLISEDEEFFEVGTQKWKHPFFQKWQIKLPHGYHGINADDVEVVHTYTKTPEYKADYSSGIAVPGTIKIYNDAACTSVYTTVTSESEVKSYRIYGTEYTYVESIDDLDEDDEDARTHLNRVINKYYMREGAGYDANPNVTTCRIKIGKKFKYVKKEDCYMDILRYKEVDFDDEKDGISRYYYIGDYDSIERVTISDNGALTVFYHAQAEPKQLEQILRWIDTKETSGIVIDDDGSLHIYYNTTHEPDANDKFQQLDALGRAHDHQDYMNVLDWITSVTLTPEGKFTILYNNDTVKVGVNADGVPIHGNKYETTLKWIDYIDIAEDGTITFRWNTDVDRDGEPAYQFVKKIKYLTDVQIQTTKTDENDPRYDGYEGTGDQLIHVGYNVDDVDYTIGQPLNYIIETCISIPTTDYPDAPFSHLLVYYADPDLRLRLKRDKGYKWVEYPSTKVIDRTKEDGTPVYHVWKEWVDLGECRGSSGGIHIIKNVASLDELKDADGNFLPPERLTDEDGNIISPDGAGWACSMDVENSDNKQILFYDYEIKKWYSIGTLDLEAIDPSCSIIVSRADENEMPASEEVGLLKNKGIWFGISSCIFAR